MVLDKTPSTKLAVVVRGLSKSPLWPRGWTKCFTFWNAWSSIPRQANDAINTSLSTRRNALIPWGKVPMGNASQTASFGGAYLAEMSPMSHHTDMKDVAASVYPKIGGKYFALCLWDLLFSSLLPSVSLMNSCLFVTVWFSSHRGLIY